MSSSSGNLYGRASQMKQVADSSQVVALQEKLAAALHQHSALRKETAEKMQVWEAETERLKAQLSQREARVQELVTCEHQLLLELRAYAEQLKSKNGESRHLCEEHEKHIKAETERLKAQLSKKEARVQEMSTREHQLLLELRTYAEQLDSKNGEIRQLREKHEKQILMERIALATAHPDPESLSAPLMHEAPSPDPLGTDSNFNMFGDNDVQDVVRSFDTRGSHCDMPSLGFVINFRRLILIKHLCDVMHQLIQATAFAALTLLNVESKAAAIHTSIFVSSVFVVYVMHESVFDSFDADDVNQRYELVCNDDAEGNADARGVEYNPNRLLKSLSTHRRGCQCTWHFTRILLIVLSLLGWALVVVHACSWGQAAEELGLGLSEWIFDEKGVYPMAMQLATFCFMFLFELLYEYIRNREMRAVMPPPPRNPKDSAPTGAPAVWDPRKHGTPWWWLWGLPSMWFTSKEAYKNLQDHVSLAKPGQHPVDIYPFELAIYALQGNKERLEATCALKGAQKFNASAQKMVTPPEKLDIQLCFFDDQGKDSDKPCVGALTYFQATNQAFLEQCQSLMRTRSSPSTY